MLAEGRCKRHRPDLATVCTHTDAVKPLPHVVRIRHCGERVVKYV